MFAEWIFQLPSGSGELTQNIRVSVLNVYHLQLANISLLDCHNDFMFFSCKSAILIALSESPQVTLVAMPLTLDLSINYRFKSVHIHILLSYKLSYGKLACMQFLALEEWGLKISYIEKPSYISCLGQTVNKRKIIVLELNFQCPIKGCSVPCVLLS